MNSYDYKQITDGIIGAAIEVHKTLGPGLLESAYRECLAREFLLRNIAFAREVPVPVVYKGVHLECGYRLDFLVANSALDQKLINTQHNFITESAEEDAEPTEKSF